MKTNTRKGSFTHDVDGILSEISHIEFNSFDSLCEYLHKKYPGMDDWTCKAIASERFARDGRRGSRKGYQDFTQQGIINVANGIRKIATSQKTAEAIGRKFGNEDQKNAIALKDQQKEQSKKNTAEQVRRNNLTDEERRAEDNMKSVQNRIKSEEDRRIQEDLYNQMDPMKEQKAQEKAQREAQEQAERDARTAQREAEQASKQSMQGSAHRPSDVKEISGKINSYRTRGL